MMNLLGIASDTTIPRRFITKKWVEVNDKSGGAYNTKKIRFKTSMLRSDLSDFSDASIVVKGTIAIDGAENRAKQNRKLVLEN